MNEANIPEPGLHELHEPTDDAAPDDDPKLATPEATPTALEQRDQEQVAALVDKVITQYKQALRENQLRHAQDILEAAQREPQIAELLLPKLQIIEQMQHDMDTLKDETVATFKSIQTMMDTFSQDGRNMHAINPQQAAALLDSFRPQVMRINQAQDINSAANALIGLADWTTLNLKPTLVRTARALTAYFSGQIPQEINDEGSRLQKLANQYVVAGTNAAAIRRSFDAV